MEVEETGKLVRPVQSTKIKSERSLLARLQAGFVSRDNTITPYFYLLPAFIIYVIFFFYPFIQVVWISFHRWDGIQPRRWVGLDNYQRLLFEDPEFWLALRHNVYWLLAALVVPIVLGLFLAILLTRSRLRGKTFFRTVYFLPQVLSTVVVAIIWNWIYNPSFGALNTFLELIGLESLRQGWLGEPNFALLALFIAWSWIYYGFAMVIFVAALQSIDETYFDAAKIDGASWFQQLRHILIPFIQGPLTTVLLMTAISSFQVFDIVFVLTRGGPAGNTMILAILMYENAFGFNKVGYGSAIAVVLAIIVLILSIIFLRVRGALNQDALQ